MRLGTTPFLFLLLTLTVTTAWDAHAGPKKPQPTLTATASPMATRTPTTAPTRTPTAPVGAVSIAITEPLAGTAIRSNQLNVQGTFQGPPNTGVTVNDRVAYVSGGRFMLNALPLNTGTNLITAVATAPTGESARTTVTVDAAGSPPDLVLNADVTSGASPLVVTFKYDFRSGQAIQKLAVDFDGDGRSDFSTKKPPMAMQNSYTRSGLYVATLTITDRLGQVYKASLGIEVRAWDVRDSLFHAVWGAMTDALARGDVEAALQPLNTRARERYAPIFNELAADLPSIVSSYSVPQFVSEGPGYLEYAVARLIDGETKIFFVYLLQDADGVWRMDSF